MTTPASLERRDASQAAHDVRFIMPTEFLDELRADHTNGCIRDSIVRLSMSDGVCTIAMTEPDRAWDDRPLPGSVARARYIECAYISTRAQLVKLSRFVGFVWTTPADDADRAHNDEVTKRQSFEARRMQAALAALQGVVIRGGGLYVDDGTDWTAQPDQMLEAPPELSCAYCNEPIYFASGVWRHKASGRAEALVAVKCDGCDGKGEVTVAGAQRQCPRCNGLRTWSKVDHVAEVAEAVTVGMVGT